MRMSQGFEVNTPVLVLFFACFAPLRETPFDTLKELCDIPNVSRKEAARKVCLIGLRPRLASVGVSKVLVTMNRSIAFRLQSRRDAIFIKPRSQRTQKLRRSEVFGCE